MKLCGTFHRLGFFYAVLLGTLACVKGQAIKEDPSKGQSIAPELAKLEEGLSSVEDVTSAARQRLTIRRVIRDAETALNSVGNQPERWAILELLFRAHQRLVALDDDKKYRETLMESARELVKAPDEFASCRMEADLLLSQVEQAKRGNEPKQRADALRAFVNRYLDTSASAKALRTTMLMALELGDTRLVNDLRKIIATNFSGDLEMIAFLRDHLGGQVFGVPFVGSFKRSDGKTMLFPMDGLGHSLMVIFWSKDSENILQYLTDMAAAYELDQERVDGRLEIISVNMDELPDAGESIIRSVGADWPCLHFPGGRKSLKYKAYVRVDPLNLRVAPTGQAAMVMDGSTRRTVPKKPEQLKAELKEVKPTDDLKNYTESFRRTLIRDWSRDDYAMHLSALMTGDFLIFDPEGEFNPEMPPELKAAAKGGAVSPLERDANCVPEETLQAIQDCLIAPPERYHITQAEARASYQKMQDLCHKAIAAHPNAPDLWIVRNRLILSHLGLWKTDFDLKQFEAAVAESRKLIEEGCPDGCDVMARFTLARQALRDPNAHKNKVIDDFVAEQGGESAHGSVFATACILSLDIANEARYHKFRNVILKDHTEYPMMWLFSSFLLSRYHDYWMFQVPFTAGWSFGRRLKYEMNKGELEEATRYLKLELPTLDGKKFRIPDDLKTEYSVIFFAQPQPWQGRDREDPKPPSPMNVLRSVTSFINSREDVELKLAMLGDMDEASLREHMKARGDKEPWSGTILRVPKGMNDPLIHRLGLLDDRAGALILDKQGRILNTLSGSALGNIQSVIPNTIHLLDEKKVMNALVKGDVKAAEKLIMQHVPPYDPEAKDDRGRKLPVPKYSVEQLRSRCHYYMALKQWDKALVDAEAVAAMELGAAGGMSLRTDELDKAEALRDLIKEKAKSP